MTTLTNRSSWFTLLRAQGDDKPMAASRPRAAVRVAPTAVPPPASHRVVDVIDRLVPRHWSV